MIRPDCKKWHQSPDDLLRLAIQSEHSRTRERFLALYMVASGQANASQWAQQIGRENESVMDWIHRYNASGPDALRYRHTGGPTPLLRRRKPSRSSIPSKTANPKRMACPDVGGR
jgi:hypothetical protein